MGSCRAKSRTFSLLARFSDGFGLKPISEARFGGLGGRPNGSQGQLVAEERRRWDAEWCFVAA